VRAAPHPWQRAGETSPWGPVLIVTGLVEEEQVRIRRRPRVTLVHNSVPTSLGAHIFSRRATVVAARPPPDRRPPLTAVPSTHQNEVVALAERLGATVNLSFSKDDPFDFCVAKTVNSPKYLLARARGVPAATPAWLRDSVAAGAFIKLDGPDVPSGYRPPPFAGLSVCVTGHSQDERADIEKRVVAYGGAYASDLVKGVCTHLIAADTTSAKYAHASRWDGVCIVKKEWVDACIAEKSRADETEFRVAASSAETTRRDSSARKSKDAGEDEDFSAEDAEERAGRLVPWGSCFLLSTRVCLYGFERDSDEHSSRAPRRAARGRGDGFKPRQGDARGGNRRSPPGVTKSAQGVQGQGRAFELAGGV
jgi:topoisomerase (DNA) II binding protein 1